MQALTVFFISNLCISALLAALAVLVGRKVRNPQVVHALWLLVLLKLVPCQD